MLLDNKKKRRLVYLGVYVLAACLFVYAVKPVYLVSLAIVLMPPALVNFFWLKYSRRKILIFSLLSAVLFAIPVELAARLADAWDVQSVLPRLFGLVPWEDIFSAFLNFLWVLSFYEYFVDRDKRVKLSRRFRWLILIYSFLAALGLGAFFTDRTLISWNYHSLSLFVLLIPGIVIFSLEPQILRKTWLPTVFFAAVFFAYEIVSLLIGSWWWPGEYLWPVTFFGHIFPFDDIVIWYLISTPVLIGGYEFFVDDEK